MLKSVQNASAKPKAADYTKIIKENQVIIDMQEQISKLKEELTQINEKNLEKHIDQEDRLEDVRFQLTFQHEKQVRKFEE
jgi:glycyl-tRNA synthetase beta subunit